jgi:hypothetical protein
MIFMRYTKNPAMLEAMLPVKKELKRLKTVTIVLPKSFGLKDHDAFNFEKLFNIFQWDLKDCPVKIDITKCTSSDYQALSLIVLYAWHLKDNGCVVEIIFDHHATSGVSLMWKRLGAPGTFPVLLEPNQQFKGDSYKPLFALRKGNNNKDFKDIISAIENYTDGFDISYTETLRYILSELLYNTQEHGGSYSSNLDIPIPSLVQMCWYQNKDVIQFIIADLGIGIRKHIEQTYPCQESDEMAIKLAIQPEKSGTFAVTDPYNAKNNAGMGLYLSSNIIRKLKGEMYLVSGDGLLHISPRDITSKTLSNSWKGTIAFLAIKLEGNDKNDLQSILQELRKNAEDERNKQKLIKSDEQFIVNMNNFFGDFAEIKEDAIKFRDKYLLPAIEDDKK